MRADLLGNGERLFVGYGLHLSCAEGVCGRFIVSQVKLGTNQDDRDVGGMVFNFRKPLHHVSFIVYFARSVGSTYGRCGDLLGKKKEKKSTLALTLSNEGGLTMEKQIRKTSV